jgi:hypothetical protein
MVAPKKTALYTSPLSIANVHLVAKNVEEAQDIRVVAAEEKAWKEINEKCGGSIQRYYEMGIENINELVGDKKPGYEDMTLTEKYFAWWTRMQMKIFDDIVAGEVRDH